MFIKQEFYGESIVRKTRRFSPEEVSYP